MKRLKGPEIKMPKLRAPQFLVDLYYDLDERHLLPVVVVLIVGIIAIPLLLGGSSSSSDSNSAASGASAAVASAASEAQSSAVVVAKATPGLRDYKRRLKHLQPTDPFKPRFTKKDGAEASASESTEAPPTTESASSAAPESSESSGGSPSTTTSPAKTKVTFFTYAIDVRVTPVSSGDDKSSKTESTVRRNLPPLVMLPSRDTPALTYMGPSRDGKKAVMLVSSDVTALFGDSKCIVGSESCQLLALEPGLPETVVFGPQARTYRIELLKIETVTTDHLNRAALGKPPKKHSKSKSG